MSQDERNERLTADLAALTALKEASTIFDFEASGDLPDRYTLIFHGQGICRDSSPSSDIDEVELHRCDLRLPYLYPERPPDIRWITPIFHPNISFSGFIKLRDVGLPWEPDLGLDVICERLWDVARLAYHNLDTATNVAARNWIEDDCQMTLPLDSRPLRDKQQSANTNVVRYGRRRPQPPPVEAPAAATESPSEPPQPDVFYIGEETPAPQIPTIDEQSNDDDDIFYIGDE